MQITKILLREYTSLCVGGFVDSVVVADEGGLSSVVSHAKVYKKKLHILGGGTNTFFGEHLENLLVVKMEILGIQKKQEVRSKEQEAANTILITANAGEVWDDVVKFAVSAGLWGIENLSHIPGTMGAAPVQNIGAYGVELADSFCSLRAYDISAGVFVEFAKEECNFGYRNSVFKQQGGRYIIVSVTLALSKTPKPILSYKPLDTLKDAPELSLSDVRDLVIQTRVAKLPDYHAHPNAGSFFKNPVVTAAVAEGLRALYPEVPLIPQGGMAKIPAAWLIEHVARMKGVRVGGVGTWPAQPLVIVNYGSASADEILGFSESIIQKVFSETGVLLEREVQSVLR